MTAPSDPTGGMEPIRQIAHQMEEERRKAEKVENCGNCRFWISQECRRYPVHSLRHWSDPDAEQGNAVDDD